MPYHGFSAEADLWFPSTNTQPLMIVQQGVCVCVCVCFPFLPSIIQSHSKAVTSRPRHPCVPIYCPSFLFPALWRNLTAKTRTSKHVDDLKFSWRSFTQLGSALNSHWFRLTSGLKAISETFWQHLTDFWSYLTLICSVYLSHLLRGWHLFKMEGFYQTLSFKEGTQQHLANSLQRMHTHKHTPV